jgi:hypothetical protein
MNKIFLYADRKTFTYEAPLKQNSRCLLTWRDESILQVGGSQTRPGIIVVGLCLAGDISVLTTGRPLSKVLPCSKKAPGDDF